ncbi:protein FAM26F [Trichonephila inaurata madagascariensis]|uniref:Protein FAM26F n=1 Tax=Trichonephila inaurata madagascariensis TaxID=2747483 RepID=A0A8X6MA50_9ARAC|nr:protein FAM26F [Trichonephila inaurata madagascariensis]
MYRKKTAHISRSVACNTFWGVFARALIVPSTWLFVSLLDGDYYACQYSDHPIDENSGNYLQYKADSQVFAWMFLVIVIAVGAFVTCCVRCADNKTFLEARYAGVHQLEETTLLEEKMRVVAKAEVKKHLDALFENNIPPKATWDEATKVDYGNNDKAYYTPLYRWAITPKSEAEKPGEQSVLNPSQTARTVEGNQNELPV